MNELLQEYSMFCEWAPAHWLVFSDNVFHPLIYYSHLVPILLSLPLAVVIYLNNRDRIQNQLFLLLVLLFSLWTFGDLILWADDNPATIMFVWSVLILLEPLMYLCAYCFAHKMLSDQHIPAGILTVLMILVAPVILLTPTHLMIESFNLTNCFREVTEGPLVYYSYAIQVVISLLILTKTIVFTLGTQIPRRQKVVPVLASVSILLFMWIFSFGNIAGSFFEDWTIGQYGIFGMPVMVALIGYLISRYHAFNTNIFASQLLVTALAILVLSIIFVPSLTTVRVVAMATFVLILVIGYLLVKSIKSEIEQRELAQRLATELSGANARLERLDKMKSEFMSIASHQLRSPLTSIRGYVSMILEGSYGVIDDKTKEVLTRVNDSAKNMALSIDDFLNVSRIEAGNMKYDLADADIRQVVENIVSDMQPVSTDRGIPLILNVSFEGPAMSKIDIGKTRQIIQNLVDNAFKYNKDGGSVTLTLSKDDVAKKIHVDVKDQGIGLSPESISNLFGKFERAKNASSANVSGSGLGLYIARTMAREMGGDIVVTSPGEGHGSTFTASFPLNGIVSEWTKTA